MRHALMRFSDLVGADPGLDESGDVLRYPGDEAVCLVENQVEFFRHLFLRRVHKKLVAEAGVRNLGAFRVTRL